MIYRIYVTLFCFIMTFLLYGCGISFPQLFEYEKKNSYTLDSCGNICHPESLVPHLHSTVKVQLTPEGAYQISDNSGLHLSGKPGERIFPIHETTDGVYFLSEHNSNFMQLFYYNRLNKAVELISGQEKDVFSAIIVKDKIRVLIYDGDRFSYDFFDVRFATIHRKISLIYKDCYILWDQVSSDGRECLLQVFSSNRPVRYLLCNLDMGSWQEVSACYPFDSGITGKKETFTFRASDGVMVSGILTFPRDAPAGHPLPLIVFPHGGPQSHTMNTFDGRVAILCHAGYLVFQPNFRGSTGYGKTFRQAGWQAGGILRALTDIAEGTQKLIESGVASSQKVAIMGGSWGGYCALASLALYPELYKAGISFFGASDLVAMLHEFLPDSGADAALDKLQYGDITVPEVAEKMKKISPYFQCGKIKVPVLLYHFEDDKVISFQQSEKFYKKMKKLGKEIVFISGKGEHGFATPAKEAMAYEQVIKFLRNVFQHNACK